MIALWRIFLLFILLSSSKTAVETSPVNPVSYNIIQDDGITVTCAEDSQNCTFISGPSRDLLKRAFAFSNKFWKCHDLRCRKTVPRYCAYQGEDECAQINFQCAEYVSRSLAAAGLMPGIHPYQSRVRDLVRYIHNGIEYNIGFASKKFGMLGLKELLENQPEKWQKFTCTPFIESNATLTHEINRNRTLSSGKCRPEVIRPGSVLIMKNGRHSGVAVDFNKVNTHNPARFQQPFDEYTHFPINYIFSPIFV